MDLLTGFRLRTSYSNESHKPTVRHFLTWIFQNSHCLLPIFRLERTQEKSTNRAWDSILPFDSTFDIWIACMLVGFYVHSQQASESYGPHLLWFDLPFTVQCDFRIASVLLSPTRSWKHCWPWDTASQSCKRTMGIPGTAEVSHEALCVTWHPACLWNVFLCQRVWKFWEKKKNREWEEFTVNSNYQSGLLILWHHIKKCEVCVSEHYNWLA